VIYLEYDPNPDPAVLAWADELLKTHVDRRAISNNFHDVTNGGPGQVSLSSGRSVRSVGGQSPRTMAMIPFT
jgi:hypothetical protein